MTTITLPPEIEQPLAEAAQRQGTTPERLALESLRQIFVPAPVTNSAGGQSLFDALSGYLGTIQGSKEAFSERCGERFADGLSAKAKSDRP